VLLIVEAGVEAAFSAASDATQTIDEGRDVAIEVGQDPALDSPSTGGQGLGGHRRAP
jgi:hypothetical protein